MRLSSRRFVTALSVGLFTLANQSAIAASIDSKVFAKKLLQHIGNNVCASGPAASKCAFDNSCRSLLTKPIDIQYRSFKWSFKDEEIGLAELNMLAAFKFSGGASYQAVVRVFIKPKGGMFNADGNWVMAEDFNGNATVETQSQNGDVDCSFRGWDFKQTKPIPTYEFNPNYKD